MAVQVSPPLTSESSGIVQDAQGVLLRYTCPLSPLPARTRRAKRRIGRYYQTTVAAWRNRWTKESKAEGLALRTAAAEHGTRFLPGTMRLTTQVLYAAPSCISILQDAMEDWGDGRPILIRSAVTWDTRSGWPIPLQAFLPQQKAWRKTVLEAVCKEGRRRIQSGEFLLDEPLEKVLTREFSPDHFFLSPKGLFVFYPMCSVGPYVEGIPIFPVPTPLFPPFGPCIPLEKEL